MTPIKKRQAAFFAGLGLTILLMGSSLAERASIGQDSWWYGLDEARHFDAGFTLSAADLRKDPSGLCSISISLALDPGAPTDLVYSWDVLLNDEWVGTAGIWRAFEGSPIVNYTCTAEYAGDIRSIALIPNLASGALPAITTYRNPAE